MRTIHRSTVWTALLMAAALCLPAAAAEPVATQVAIASVGAGGMSWQPQVDHEALVLTISGNDIHLTLRFKDGEQPTFAGVDDEGYALPDGSYTWQLSVIPRADELEPREYANGRSNEDGSAGTQAEAPKGLSQSGSFTISRGAFVNPDESEADAGPYNN